MQVPEGQESTHEIFVKYYEGSEGLIEDEITQRIADKEWDGTRRSYYRNGNLWCEDTFKDGKLWSIEVDFLPDGSPVEGAFIVDGKGHQKVYTEDGILDSEGDRLNGERDGVWLHFHPNGNKKAEELWKDGKQTGERKTFNEAGQLIAIDIDTQDGWHHQEFGPTGAPTIEGSYVKDEHGYRKQVGLWRTHKEHGAILITDFDDQGKSYYDPLPVLAAYRDLTEPKAQARAMLNACGNSAIELDKALWRLKADHAIELSIPLRVELLCQPSVGFLTFCQLN